MEEFLMHLKLAKACAEQMIKRPQLNPWRMIFYRVGSQWMTNRDHSDGLAQVQSRYKVKVHGPYTPEDILKM